ncbi:DUF1772 domain-containing protein [Ruania zhangjianzhongii]|uniref:DUF1772 domain-containing protein n=1 Tax=Ruania zhangjianzhongii TaxID=2603206 RepID=UPI001F3CCD68|nr:DUF1772 domain-containing protein [Ruania zhangjianzhongii]
MSAADLLMVAALVLPGFTACAEFGSYAFVHPVIRRLPTEHHVAVEKGLVRTFGRFMPVAMPLSLAVLIGWASVSGVGALSWGAVGLWSLGLATTIAVNVGINARTARVQTGEMSAAAWLAMRTRWEVFQGVRSWAFLLAFILVCVAAAGR